MSKTFAERFKGRIEEFQKNGIQQIISSSSHPVNDRMLANQNDGFGGNYENKENQRFSKNAQMNILDFNKNFQTMIKPSQYTSPVYSHDYLNPKYGRPVYSAFDNFKPTNSQSPNYGYSDQHHHVYPNPANQILNDVISIDKAQGIN